MSKASMPSIATFKYSSVWYSVLPRDATIFSEASEMELVKFFSHDGGTKSKIHSRTRAWLVLTPQSVVQPSKAGTCYANSGSDLIIYASIL